ncbi:MAG: Arc family DNA-binding protein [Roseateles sp.]
MVAARNLPDEVHRALQARATQHGRSAEAEVLAILEAAVMPASRLRMGEAMAAIGRNVGLTDKAVEALKRAQDKAPADPMRFEP